MGNIISNDKANQDMALRNGATEVLLSVLVLAGSDLAKTDWEKNLVTWLAEHDQSLFGIGCVGFDLGEIAWSRTNFNDQKFFLLRVVNLAATRHRWEVLDYDPPYALQYLADFRRLVDAFVVEMVDPEHDWDWCQPPEEFLKCPRHDVYQHANGCLLCDDRVS